MKPLDTSPLRGYRMARKHGIHPLRAVAMTVTDTWTQLWSYLRYHGPWYRPSDQP